MKIPMGAKENSWGFTLIELVVVVALTGFVVLALVSFGGQIVHYFPRAKANQHLNNDARIAMETVAQRLRQGIASSVWRCSCAAAEKTCAETACVAPDAPSSDLPFSHIDLAAQDHKAYSFYWVNGALAMDVYVAGTSAPPIHRVLADNVASVTFGGDLQDPGVIGVSLTLVAPPQGPVFGRAVISNRTVHLVNAT